MKKFFFLSIVVFLVASVCVSQVTDISVLQEVDSNGYPTHFGTNYTIRGIITTTNMDGFSLQFFMEDSTGGIQIYSNGNSAWYDNKSLAVGADLTITGDVGFYNGTLELIPSAEGDLTNNGTGTLPTPQTITIDDLQDEADSFALRGELVKLEDVYMTTGSDSWPSSGNNANLTIAIGSDSGTPTSIMRIDKDFDCDENSEPTWPQTVTAIFTQYDSTSPYKQSFQITPTAYADFSPYSSVSDWDLY